MTAAPTSQDPFEATPSVKHVTRFTITLPSGQQIHGVEWPSGRVLVDDPIEGFTVAVTLDDLVLPLNVVTLERISDDPTAELERLRAALRGIGRFCSCDASRMDCPSSIARSALAPVADRG